ncbi:MAG TPA: response regulator [Gammaproteobacteria bacterium]|nr:response regulator [Gammaproteobacteria bacterium]
MSTDPLPCLLVVDDSRVMRVSLRKILAAEFDVLEAEDGEQAWQLLASHDDVQVVLSDLSMPNLDGYGLLERIRASENPAIQSLPVIIITGKEDDAETKEDVLARGASDFITKPFEAVHIRARAHSHLQHYRTRETLSHTQQKLRSEATVDESTGLGSARYLKKMAAEMLAQIRRGHGRWIWLRLHIDDFRDVYVNHGKTCCEDIISRIGGVISSTVRDGDHAAILAPGQFMLILRTTDPEGARVLAGRLQEAVSKSTFYAGEEELRLTVSIAINEPYIDVDTSVDDILALSAQLMEQATAAGNNHIVMDVVEPEIPEPMDLAEALLLVEQGHGNRLAMHKQHLYRQLLPLLDIIAVDAAPQLHALTRAMQMEPVSR